MQGTRSVLTKLGLALLVVTVLSPSLALAIDPAMIQGPMSGPSRDLAVDPNIPLTSAPTGDLSVLGRWGYGPSHAVAVMGDWMFIGNGARLEVFDVTAPATPVLTKHLDMTGFVQDLFLDGDVLYVGTTRGAAVVDLSDPTVPAVTGVFAENDDVSCVITAGDFIYLGINPGRVIMFETTSLSRHLTVDPGGYLTDFLIYDDHLLVGRKSDTTLILSAQNLATINTISQTSGAMVLANKDSVLFAACDVHGLVTMNMADVTSPKFMDGSPEDYATGLTLKGDHAYFSYLWGIRVVDVRDPWVLTPVASIETGFPWASAQTNHHLFVGDNDGGFRVFDLAISSSPALVHAHEKQSLSRGLLLDGDHLYVAQSLTGVKTLDVSDPSLPVQVGAIAPFDDDAVDYRAFAATGSALLAVNSKKPGLVSFDRTDPANLAVLDTLGLWNANAVAMSGTYAYIGSLFEGLIVVDVSDPANLTEVGRVETVFPFDLLVANGALYAVEPGAGLHVLDLSNPAAPTPVTLIDTYVFNPYGLAYAAPYLYVADFELGGVIVAIEPDPLNPTDAGSFSASQFTAIAAHDGYLMTQEYLGDFTLWDLTDPIAPTSVGTAPCPDRYALSMVMDRNRIYASVFSSGVLVLKNDNVVAADMAFANLSWLGGVPVLDWRLSRPDAERGFVVWRQEAGGVRTVVSDRLVSEQGAYRFIDTAAPLSSDPLTYWLETTSDAGRPVWYGPYVLAPRITQTANLEILANVPNPFNPRTEIRFQLSRPEAVRVAVYDLEGRLVQTVFDGMGVSGLNRVSWNGTDGEAAMPSGVYLVRVAGESAEHAMKVILAR